MSYASSNYTRGFTPVDGLCSHCGNIHTSMVAALQCILPQPISLSPRPSGLSTDETIEWIAKQHPEHAPECYVLLDIGTAKEREDFLWQIYNPDIYLSQDSSRPQRSVSRPIPTPSAEAVRVPSMKTYPPSSGKAGRPLWSSPLTPLMELKDDITPTASPHMLAAKTLPTPQTPQRVTRSMTRATSGSGRECSTPGGGTPKSKSYGLGLGLTFGGSPRSQPQVQAINHVGYTPTPTPQHQLRSSSASSQCHFGSSMKKPRAGGYGISTYRGNVL